MLEHFAFQGDKVLTVRAKDGDRGAVRSLRYRLNPDESSWAKYFLIDRDSGDVWLGIEMSDLREKLYEDAPIVLAVVAEELVGEDEATGSRYPLLSSTAMVGLRVVDGQNRAPVFQSDRYAISSKVSYT